MNIFDQYGIKEVADVTLYSIHKKQDGSGDIYYVPALFLDTLKISSFDKAAEDVWAEGGYGNARLISWDFGKKIDISLEDALCTPASLGLCWGGILSADWQDNKVDIKTGVVNNRNIDRIDRLEKAFYPRSDKEEATISNLLPRLKDDYLDKSLDLLKISSVVDGTDIRGFGCVGTHSYQWKLVIESVVSSVAQVPDRFFDINGQSYPIDINRKVSVNSLPTYENYKDAIIYKINSKTKMAPPLAKIIFDDAMESKGRIINKTINVGNQDSSTLTLAQLLNAAGYIIHVDGILELNENNEKTYYLPLRNLNTQITFTEIEDEQYVYNVTERLYQILDSSIIDSMIPETISAAALSNTKVTYAENHAMTDLCGINGQINLDHEGSVEEVAIERDICEADYLAVIVDNNNEYHTLIGVYTNIENNEPKDRVIWYKPSVPVDTSQFKGLDMWLRFDSINEMIYFLLTKYSNDIITIDPSTVNANEGKETWGVDDKKTTLEQNTDSESYSLKGKLWAYLNPKTMTPYSDDYWFQQGEPYLIKSLTLAKKTHPLKANKIIVKAGVWPGMYMLVGETWIRSYETGQDEKMQIKVPFCKVKSNNTLTLEADGDPTVFSLDLEVAKPPCGNMIEITTFETRNKMKQDENGNYYIVDGSTEILSE